MSVDLQITSLAESAVPQAAELQARAFHDDPAFVFTFQSDDARRERLPRLMNVGVGYGVRFGQVFTTAESPLGHSVWLPPGETSLSPEKMNEVGFDAASALMSEDELEKFGSFMDMVAGHHHRLVPAPHWYLLILGVDPPHQGRGVGSSLIAPGLARADAEGLPCYLETAKERNLAFYRRHGFEVRHEEHIPGGGPLVWMMVREPR